MSAAILTPRARQELLAAARWIRRDNRAVARAFNETVARAAERIGRHPAIGVVRPDLLPHPYRFVSLTGFPYVVVYNAARDPPLIVAILHASRDLGPILERDPGKWSYLSARHGRARPGHPRQRRKLYRFAWIPGTRPGMTIWWIADRI